MAVLSTRATGYDRPMTDDQLSNSIIVRLFFSNYYQSFILRPNAGTQTKPPNVRISNQMVYLEDYS